MKNRWLHCLAAVAGLGAGFSSPPEPRTGAVPPPPKASLEQRLGAKVPLHLPLKDEAGDRVTLGGCTGGKPTVLVLAYYRCPMLCTQVLNNLVEALKDVPDDVGATFNVVVVSFDPREKPPLAAMKKASYLEVYGRPGADKGWHFLTGDPLAVASLADAVGFRYSYDESSEQFAHPSGIMVLAADGTIDRYLLGVRYPSRDLRLALAEASAGRVGTPADQVLLLCFHYDPTAGAYTFQVLRFVRLLSGVFILGVGVGLGILAWRYRRTGSAPDGRPPAPQPLA